MPIPVYTLLVTVKISHKFYTMHSAQTEPVLDKVN